MFLSQRLQCGTAFTRRAFFPAVTSGAATDSRRGSVTTMRRMTRFCGGGGRFGVKRKNGWFEGFYVFCWFTDLFVVLFFLSAVS